MQKCFQKCFRFIVNYYTSLLAYMDLQGKYLYYIYIYIYIYIIYLFSLFVNILLIFI